MAVRRDAIALDDVAKPDNLLLAVWKAARGKRQRPAVARFLADLENRLAAMASAILEERAPRGRFRRFTIHDPKRRVITAACFADRVLHHAILNLAEPRFERMLVDSSYACRPGKGIHVAIRRAAESAALAVVRARRHRRIFSFHQPCASRGAAGAPLQG